jgi:hypothetical protein
VKSEDLLNAISTLLNEFERFEGYLHKEVVIKRFLSSDDNAGQFLAAGTAPLDYILYLAYKNNDQFNQMFNIVEVSDITEDRASKNLNNARSVFMAWVLIVMTRGNHPVSSGDDRPLPKILLKGDLDNTNITNEKSLAKLCSSAPLSKFPADMILKMEFKTLPDKYYARILLSSAGTRAIRYAILSMSFAKDNDSGMVSMTKQLAESQMNCKVKVKMHPLFADKKIPRMTLTLTKMVMMSLTREGRQAFARMISESDYDSFKKDKMIKIDHDRGDMNIMFDASINLEGVTTEIISWLVDQE